MQRKNPEHRPTVMLSSISFFFLRHLQASELLRHPFTYSHMLQNAKFCLQFSNQLCPKQSTTPTKTEQARPSSPRTGTAKSARTPVKRIQEVAEEVEEIEIRRKEYKFQFKRHRETMKDLREVIDYHINPTTLILAEEPKK